MQIKSVVTGNIIQRTPSVVQKKRELPKIVEQNHSKPSEIAPAAQQSGFKIVSVTGNVGSEKRSIGENDIGSRKRIKPTLVSAIPTKSNPEFDENDPLVLDLIQDGLLFDDDDAVIGEPKTSNEDGAEERQREANHPPQTPMNDTFEALIEACRAADPSPEMGTLIDKKLIKYYRGSHPTFVNSDDFINTVKTVIKRIKQEPKMVYLIVKDIVDELDMRRKNYSAVEEDPPTTGDPKTDLQIKKLSKAMVECQKMIKRHDEAEVDFDEEHNSHYIMAEKFKKRFCELHRKMCELTGEDRNAKRAVFRPIKYRETNFDEFNQTVQNWINRAHEFPDYVDVFKMLEHCNTQYQYGLNKDGLKRIAESAFISLGKTLSTRRRADLYETVEYFGSGNDPALDDPVLQAQLESNRQIYQRRMDEVINQ